MYSHTCYAYGQGFLPCLFLPFRSIHLHFFPNLSQCFPVLAGANTGSCVGPQNKIRHPAGCRFPCWVLAEYREARKNMTCGMMTCGISEQLGDRVKFVFSPDVILCGWLGSKHQLTVFVSLSDCEMLFTCMCYAFSLNTWQGKDVLQVRARINFPIL